MKELELLESELLLLTDCIARVKKFQEDNKNIKYKPDNSLVFGELKHRLIAIKQRATILNKISTRDLFWWFNKHRTEGEKLKWKRETK